MSIPTISISSSRPRHEIVTEIRSACLKYGFFQITAHSIPQDLLSRAFRASTAFFDLPVSTKLPLTKESPVKGGYEPFKTYSLRPTGPNVKDLHEGFSVAPPQFCETRWPIENLCQDFQQTILDYYREAQNLSAQVFALIAEGLGLDSHYFDPYLCDQMAWVRLIHYYPPNEDEKKLGAAGAGEHTDWGALTLLAQDSVGGLEVYDRDTNTWIPVPPVANAITVNLGDLMSRWTNDLYRSTLHRVIPPPQNTHRYSIPFFNSGNIDYRVHVISTCIKEGDEAKYPPITAGEYIQWKHEQSVREY